MENPKFEPGYQTPGPKLSNSTRPVSYADERLQALASEVEARLSSKAAGEVPGLPDAGSAGHYVSEVGVLLLAPNKWRSHGPS